MQVDRRQVLLGSPVLAAAAIGAIGTISAIEVAQTDPIEVNVTRIAQRLRVGDAAVEGALTRLERFLPQPAAMFAGTGLASGAYRLGTPQFVGAGRWRFEDVHGPLPDLGQAIAIGCRGAGVGSERGVRLRWMAGCAFGGLTVLVYKARRATVGLIVPGHHFGMPPLALHVGP